MAKIAVYLDRANNVAFTVDENGEEIYICKADYFESLDPDKAAVLVALCIQLHYELKDEVRH